MSDQPNLVEGRDRNSPRAAPTGPIDYVLDQLSDIVRRIDEYSGKGPGTGMLQKYDYFCRVSERGRACSFSLKSKQLFLNSDLPDILEMIEKLLYYIRDVPGNEDFGK